MSRKFCHRGLCVAVSVLAATLCGLQAQPTVREYYFPQVISGRGLVEGRSTILQTVFQIVNLGDETIDGGVALFTDEGEPLDAFFVTSGIGGFSHEWGRRIPPRGVGRLFTEPFREFRTGWARITVSGEGPVFIQVNFGRHVSRGPLQGFSTVSMASVEVQPLTTDFLTFPEFDYDQGRNDVGLAFLNPSETETAEIRLRLMTAADGRLEEERTLTLAPGGRTTLLLRQELFPNSTFLESVRVLSSIPIAAAVISVDGLSWTAGRLIGSPRLE